MPDTPEAQVVEMVHVPAAKYAQMVKRLELLSALEAAGVDNWEGWDYATGELPDSYFDD